MGNNAEAAEADSLETPLILIPAGTLSGGFPLATSLYLPVSVFLGEIG